MKTSDTQKYKINEAYEKSNSVLTEIRQKTLVGKNLEDMKILETAVQCLEIFMLSTT